MTQQDIKDGKGLSIISYLGIIGIIIAYFMNNDKKNPFISFNVRQSLGLWIMFHLFAFSSRLYTHSAPRRQNLETRTRPEKMV